MTVLRAFSASSRQHVNDPAIRLTRQNKDLLKLGNVSGSFVNAVILQLPCAKVEQDRADMNAAYERYQSGLISKAALQAKMKAKFESDLPTALLLAQGYRTDMRVESAVEAASFHEDGHAHTPSITILRVLKGEGTLFHTGELPPRADVDGTYTREMLEGFGAIESLPDDALIAFLSEVHGHNSFLHSWPENQMDRLVAMADVPAKGLHL